MHICALLRLSSPQCLTSTEHLGGTIALCAPPCPPISTVSTHWKLCGTRSVHLSSDAKTTLKLMQALSTHCSMPAIIHRHKGNSYPVFWEIGLTQDGKTALSNPQALNSYGYANDNPITGKDPNGRCPWCLPSLVGGAAGGLSQWAGDMMANRAAGLTGVAVLAPRSSWQEYNAAIIAGAATGYASTFGVLAAGGTSAIGSAYQDYVAGRDVSVDKSLATGVGTIATGGFFKWGAGASPAEIYMKATGRAFSSLPSNVFRNELRYIAANEVFGSSANTIIQSRYQSVRNYNTSIGASMGGGGGAPSNNSLWVTPSGAVVSWGGQLIVGPAAQSTPTTVRK
jgi:hypothetical protein